MSRIDTVMAECLKESGLVSSMDLHFARLMDELGKEAPGLFLAAALASSQTRFGHICLDLTQVAGKKLVGDPSVDCPDLETWTAMLRNNPVVGRPGDYRPLVLDDQCRLYLCRYWSYEYHLAEYIVKRLSDGPPLRLENQGRVKERLDRLFRPDDRDQKVAACVAALQNFAVISGGPGTGKTTTVTRLLALLIESFLDKHPGERMAIKLAAPTGKAAARLMESMGKAVSQLHLSDQVMASFPDEVSTVHRLLGYIPHSPYFRFNEKRKLHADVVIVDEASMVDLALMSKLTSALDEHTRLILIGDQDQLASVEAGAVLGDICNTGASKHYEPSFGKTVTALTGVPLGTSQGRPSETGIENGIAMLSKSYRFSGKSGIGALSRAVNAGDTESMDDVFKKTDTTDAEILDLPDPQDLYDAVRDRALEGYGAYLKQMPEQPAFDLFDGFRILCAVRKGPYGVDGMNRLVETILKDEKLIAPSREWYVGRPVMITRNDYRLGLFNGDVGLACIREGCVCVAFPGSNGDVRSFRPEKLPDHETVFAMTVHKSQGSEFDHVLLVLPESEKQVLSRELVYTGITRARKHVSLMARKDILAYAVNHRTRRKSGLRDRLWGTNVRGES